ncbi:MAG: hypothetical protein QNJ15_03190 [Erythrobacter sp.]|nr:hypothetical protein [Erythrobacter sp.]
MIAPLCCAALALAGCSVDEVSIGEPTPTPTPVATAPATFVPSIPGLAAGPHLGMITGFDPLDRERADTAEARYAEARAAGMTIGRIQIDWAELEPDRGAYDRQALEDAFADPLLAGLDIYVTLSTLDSDGLTFPAYLLDGDNLRAGLTLASPEVTGAFTDLLDWLAVQLPAHNVWAISLGNEVDSPVDDGLASSADAETFFTTGLGHWNAISPDIASTVTLTIGAIERQPALARAIRDASDLVTYNYYCLNADITVNGEAQWQGQVDRMKRAAGDREIFIQELGCPVGYSPQGRASNIGGSLDIQERYLEFFGELFAKDPQFRAATLFQLYDWSPELAASFSQAVREEGAPLAADRLEEWLATSGLVRWSDRTNRPAWDTWLAAIEGVRRARER